MNPKQRLDYSHCSLDISYSTAVRRYSLAEFHEIDFTSSDNLSYASDIMKGIVVLENLFEEVWNEDHEDILFRFLMDTDLHILFCYIHENDIHLTFHVPEVSVKEFFYFIKKCHVRVTSDRLHLVVHYACAKSPYLESLYQLFTTLYLPMFSESTHWAKCITSDYVPQLSNFISELFTMRNMLAGELVLYVPSGIIKNSIDSIIEDKDLISQMEAAVMKWMWILMRVIIKESESENKEAIGPLEEIKFWEQRSSNLQNAKDQLDSENVQKCIKILTLTKSGFLQKVNGIYSQINDEAGTANENVKLLSILIKICGTLEQARLPDIPKHFTTLLNLVRIIWHQSTYFKDKNNLTSLIHKVNNFVIKICSKHIPVNEIFLDKTTKQKDKIHDVIKCCNSWSEIFETSEKVHKKYAESTWSVEPVSILMDSFIYRCEELFEVCVAKEQFECDEEMSYMVRGHNGVELSKQMKMIEGHFWECLQELGQHKEAALDIHTTAWFDYFKRFKAEIYELDFAVSKLMTGAFEDLIVIEEGIEVLAMFSKFFNKEIIKRDVRRCVKVLYDMFLNDLNSVKRALMKKETVTNPAWPFYGGRAFWASLLPHRIDRVYKALEAASRSWPEEYDTGVVSYYEKVKDAIEEFSHTLYLQWVKTIPKDPYEWLKHPLITTNKDNPKFLDLNLDRNVLNLLQELEYWDKSGKELPLNVAKLHKKRADYQREIARLSFFVQKYNKIVGSLTPEETEMFSETLAVLEKKIKPGLIKLTWSSPSTSLNSFLNSCMERFDVTHNAFSQYKVGNVEILNNSQEIGDICMFFGSIKTPLDYEHFIEVQVSHRKEKHEQIIAQFENIREEVANVQEAFSRDSGFDEHSFFLQYVKKVDEVIDTSVKQSYLSSLNLIAALFGANRKNKIKAPLLIELTLKDHQLTYCPNIKEFGTSLDKLIEDIKNSLFDVKNLEDIFFETKVKKPHFCETADEDEEVIAIRKDIDFGIYQLYEAQTLYVFLWEPYSCLWDTSKSSILNKYQKEGFKATDFETDINKFLEVGDKIHTVQRYRTVDFCVVDCFLLKEAAMACAEEWKEVLGSILRKITCVNLQNAYNLLHLASVKFKDAPMTLNELKCSINFYMLTRENSKKAESTFTSIYENFGILTKFGVTVSEESSYQLENLQMNWTDLHHDLDHYFVILQQTQATHQRHFLAFGKEMENRANILKSDLDKKGPFKMEVSLKEAKDAIAFYEKLLIDLKEKEGFMLEDSKFFDIQIEELEPLQSVEEDLSNLKIAWSFVYEYENHLFEWENIQVLKLDVTEKKEFTDSIRQKCLDFTKIIDTKKWVLMKELLTKLDELDCYFDMVVDLQEPSLKTRHYNDFKTAMEFHCEEAAEDFFKSDAFSLKFLRGLKVDNLQDKIGAVALRARKEYSIEQTILSIRKTWKTILLNMVVLKNYYKLVETEEVFQTIENCQIALGIIKSSKYIPYFSAEVESLDNSLSLIQEVLERAEYFQKKFFHFENIFYGEDIRKQLPKESVIFDELSREWQSVTNLMHKEKFAWEVSHQPHLQGTLIDLNEKIEAIQKSLEAFLETKRLAFPRFYFMSNDDMLCILGEIKNPPAVQPHLKKCFDSIEKLEMSRVDGSRELTANGMRSIDSEIIPFVKPITLEGPVEAWLADVEEEMQITLFTLLPRCLNALNKIFEREVFDFTEVKWMNNWPGQICLLSMQVVWTAEVTTSIKTVQETAVTTALKNLKKKWRIILNQIVFRLQGEAQILMQKKIMPLILMLVHARDVIDSLLKYMCNDVNAFEWLVHLRYYYEPEKEACLVHQTTASFHYGFEYLGTRQRLVITPLTDRCFLTLTTALSLHQGTCPKGPSGTGKTETVKELGKALGNYVLIVNCSEGLDYISLGRMLSGLAQIGAWGSFDEFNRVNLEVLSVISQQIQCILRALSFQRDSFVFSGMEITLKESCGIFITVNPSYYGGRFELPQTFSQLFRPMSLIEPDVKTITEVLLFAEGFKDAKVMAINIELIFKMSQQQLSKQFHYDFGLRSVIVLIKSVRVKKAACRHASDEEIIISCIMDMFMPKLLAEDVPIFKALLKDVLGDVKVLTKDHKKMKDIIEETLKNDGFQPSASTISKILYLYEIKQYHHAIILVGESGSGKTTTWKTLKNVYCQLNQQNDANFTPVQTFVFNPKAFSIDELFGQFNTTTGTWIDGLLPTVVRNACSRTKHGDKWIVLDGPVDTQWVENMNSLMDNNKILTLINGERIPLAPEISIIIEASDVTQCSPATISRCGIVYHSCTKSGWKAYYRSWTNNLEIPKVADVLRDMADKYLELILNFKSTERSELICTTELNSVTSLCRIMNILVNEMSETENSKRNIETIFWFSLMWSIGATQNEEGRVRFSGFLRGLSEDLSALSQSVYNYGLDSKCKWILWDKMLEKWHMNTELQFNELLVPTKDTICYQYVVKTLMKKLHPVLLVGKTGTGKTLIVKDFIRNLKHAVYDNCSFNVSAKTASSTVQVIIELQLIKKARGVYLPPAGKKLVAFLDDFNMPAPDHFGTQSVLELLRMWLDYGFWYDRATWKNNFIQNVFLLAAMGPPGCGRNEISNQLLNRFSVINIVPPEEPELNRVFSSMLKHKFTEFPPNFDNLIKAICRGSLKVYNEVINTFLPTPSKIHYLFSLRDITKIFQKIMQIDPLHFTTELSVAKLWFHECTRVFSDRLMNSEDKKKCFDIISSEVTEDFPVTVSEICNNTETEPKFVDFLSPGKVFEEIKDYEVLPNFLGNCLKEFNELNKTQNLHIVLVENAVEHTCRIVRGISEPGGCMLFLGAGGTGRHSLCRLAAFLLKYELFEISLVKMYGKMEFRKDLRKLLPMVGVKRKQVVFYISESQLTHDVFLQYLSDLLTSGEVHNLYGTEEIESIYSSIMEERGKDMEKNECHELFVENVKRNLHVVICFTCPGPLYKQAILKYPAFYKTTTIDWFEEWPREALESIGLRFLGHIDIGEPTEIKHLTGSKILSDMHLSIVQTSKEKRKELGKQVNVTSATFLNLVKTFDKVLSEKRRKVQSALDRLVAGLTKILETQEKVREIAKETQEARDRLIIAERECDEALIDINEKKKIASEKQEAIQEKKVEIERKEKRCKKMAAFAQEDLNAALPALDAARKALEALNKKDIGEIKSYPKPPVIVEMVMEAVMILRGSEPTWAEAKRQLGNPQFLKELMEYDRDNIPDSALQKVQKFVSKPEFQPEIVGKVSIAAKSLCMWVRAILSYGLIYRKVKPKMEKLRLAQEELLRLQTTLINLFNELQQLNEEIEQLEKQHENLLRQKDEYAKNEKILARKLKRAETLVAGLKSEKDRWQEKVSILRDKKRYVIGDSFLSAGFLTYLGPLGAVNRAHVVTNWKVKVCEAEFLCSPSFDLVDYFVEEETIAEWITNGLPTDHFSKEGAVIITGSHYCPFIVDPQGQAVKWIKNMETDRGLKCADFSESNWAAFVEGAIVHGIPILLHNMTPELDPVLDPILKHSYTVKAHSTTITFNGKELDFDPDFRLYMSTKLNHPHFAHSVINKICIVNFAIKQKGLEDQLLPLVVLKERPDLEGKKNTLVKSIRESKKKLAELEDTILKLLNEARGSLLDDEVLVQALNKSKTTSIEVEEKLASNEKTEAVIDSAREKYRPCAKMSSILYFVLSDLSYIEPMYLFSLDSYIELFVTSINKSPRNPNADQRISKLNFYHKYAVYKFGCQAIFEKHALLLAFHMTAKLLEGDGQLNTEEYEFLLRGGEVTDRASQPPNPCSKWLTDIAWDNITQLERLPKFLDITISFDENSQAWHEWFSRPEPEKTFLPGNWRNICNEFEKMLLVRCMRLDRITSCITTFVLSNLGRKFLEPPHPNLVELFRDSSPQTPFVFILSSDMNPAVTVSTLAASTGMATNYFVLSLGQGQGLAASQLIIDAVKQGFWVFLANCHLLFSWMPSLEKIIDRLQTFKVHPDFRLFLSSLPMDNFPSSILLHSTIVTLESPKGIKANMRKLYTNIITERQYETCENMVKYKCLLFSLCFFHTIVLERKKFQFLGWNKKYFFNESDFRVSEIVLRLYLDEYRDIPWEALKEIIAEINYGGHITDERDKLLLLAYYDQFFCDEVCTTTSFLLTTSDKYFIPDDGPMESYLNYINVMPHQDTPEAFGQNANAEITFRIQEAQYIFENLMKTSSDALTYEQQSGDEFVLSRIEDIKKQLVKLIDEEAARAMLKSSPEPYHYILVQESEKYNALVRLVQQSVKELEQGIEGKLVMTPDLEKLYKSIQNAEVPLTWKKTYQSLKPLGSWVEDLKLRLQQFIDWTSTGTQPVKFWLSGFTAPLSVLNATLQIAARNNDVMVKDLIWEFHVFTLEEAHITQSPVEGVYVRGLFLEGAGWDKTNCLLVEPDPLQLAISMPVIHFKPVIESAMRGLYSCPCYYSPQRTDKMGKSSYLLTVDLKTKKPKEHWIKRATALLMSTS